MLIASYPTTFDVMMFSSIVLLLSCTQLKEDAELHLASSYPGGVVQTRVKPFVSTQFSKVWFITLFCISG